MRRTLAAILTAAALALVAGCSSSTTPSAAGGAAVSNAPIATAADPQAALKAAILDWYNGGGNDRLTKISDDATTAGTAAGSQDFTALRSGCAAIQTDVESAQSYRPIPDAELQADWSKALTKYQQGATDCVAGIDAVDATVISRATDELTAGAGFLGQATQRLQQIAAG